jgi:hypothetical protein
MAAIGDYTDYDYVKVQLLENEYFAITDGSGTRNLCVIHLDYAGGTKDMILTQDGDMVMLDSLDNM